MPEVLTKYPDIVIEILNDVPVINCGPSVPRKILKQCPPEQFCSLPAGELCIYDYKDVSKMTQITPEELTQVGGNKSKVKHNFYLVVELPNNNDKLFSNLVEVVKTTKSEYDGWETGTKILGSGKWNWENTIKHFFFLENYKDIKKVINPIRQKIKPRSMSITDFTEDPIVRMKIQV